MGRSPFSLPTQLAKRGVMEDTFSLCYGGVDGGGALLLGRMPHNVPMNYTHMHRNPDYPYYYHLELKGIKLGNTPILVSLSLAA